MRVTLITNPRSGRGKGLKAARKLSCELDRRGHQVQSLAMGDDPRLIESATADAQRVVVIGGDGTVHYLLPILAQTQTPIYHLGTGTANLISKEFGMSKDPLKVVKHLESEFEPTRIDLPTANGCPFLIMVSLGIDASVIHRFEESRSQTGGYRAYIRPIFNEIISPRPAKLTIESESNAGQQRFVLESGILVIANLKSYGGGFNPCPNADPTDGQLDAIMIPCTNSISAGFSYSVLKARRTPRRMTRMQSASFQITTKELPCSVQVDGEKASGIAGLQDGQLNPTQNLDIRISDQSILIHAPGIKSTY